MRIGRWFGLIALAAAEPMILYGEKAGGLNLTVLVCNYTDLPEAELDRAIDVAHEVFSGAGVETKWTKCVVRDNPSRSPEAPRSVFVLVNVVRSAPQDSHHLRDTVGLARLDAKGRPAMVAYVFEEGVNEALQFGGRKRFEILGFVMTHEIGHLLLATESHSETGVMQSRWAGSQMARGQAAVNFTPDEARRIRIAMRDRIKHNSRKSCRSRSS